MSTTTTPITSDWKTHIAQLHDAYEREQRIQRARAFRDKLANRKQDQQREVTALNKWLEDLHIPRQAKGPVTAHDGYVFAVRWDRWYRTYNLVIGKPNLWFHKVDPERYGKILWSGPIAHPGKVAETLAELEENCKRLAATLIPQAITPQPSLEERDPRAMLTISERNVIRYLENLIERIERQQVLNEKEALVFALTDFVDAVTFNYED